MGEWSGQLYFKNLTDPMEAYFLFHPDARVVHHLASSAKAPEIREGHYRFEYDEVPPHVHIDFSNGTHLNGLAYFSGREKNTMYIGVGSDAPPRHFSDTKSYYLLVKNAGKMLAASE